MRFKFLTYFAAALLLAACETAPEDTGAATSGGTTAPVATPTPAPPPTITGPAPGSQEHLVINVGDRIFFDYDQSELTAESRATVEALAVWLDSYQSVALNIEGHCDERGTRDYNLALGERRASAVLDYLVALGINSGRLRTISYGKERPAVLGSNEDAWAQNRRGVFTVN